MKITYETTGKELPPDSVALGHYWTSDRTGLNELAPEKFRVVALIAHSHSGGDVYSNDLINAILQAAVNLSHDSSHQLTCGWETAQWAIVERVGRARTLKIRRHAGRRDLTPEERASTKIC